MPEEEAGNDDAESPPQKKNYSVGNRKPQKNVEDVKDEMPVVVSNQLEKKLKTRKADVKEAKTTVKNIVEDVKKDRKNEESKQKENDKDEKKQSGKEPPGKDKNYKLF